METTLHQVPSFVMGKVPMQTMVSQDVRLRFELGANLAIRAIGRVCESRLLNNGF